MEDELSLYETQNDGSDWRNRAECLNEDPELFFPIGESTRQSQWQIDEAKRVCGKCAVREQCLNWALESGSEYGVWGGLSERERRTLKRRAAYRNRSS